uniref:Uncharacterized protein n=1 Tax=Knipowitschia caucasica TaxID=637954 RepID=A0AAV2J8Y7_KNICA
MRTLSSLAPSLSADSSSSSRERQEAGQLPLCSHELPAARISQHGSKRVRPDNGYRTAQFVLMRGFKISCTATNSQRSTPVCSPVLRKRSRSSTPLHIPSSTMVEKGSDQGTDRSPTSPDQPHQGPHHQRSLSQPLHTNHHNSNSGRSGGKNSRSHKRHTKKSQSWYNKEEFQETGICRQGQETF